MKDVKYYVIEMDNGKVTRTEHVLVRVGGHMGTVDILQKCLAHLNIHLELVQDHIDVEDWKDEISQDMIVTKISLYIDLEEYQYVCIKEEGE